MSDLLGRHAAPRNPQSHLAEAEAWLKRAQDQGTDDGVSYGYTVRGGWQPSYRETSGYIATTFFNLWQRTGDVEYRERALRICRWLLQVQNADGSFANPRYGDAGIVFDTGQDLFGLARAYEVSSDARFLHGAGRAADWLVRVADATGLWTRNEHLDTPHVYNTRTAWALLCMNRLISDPERERVARCNLDWALAEQRPSGFFANCSFVRGEDPFTHTIAYATRGLLESSQLLSDPRYFEAARRCADAALAHLRDDGFLPGRIDVSGRRTAAFCCLTGNCQFSIVWWKLFRLSGDKRYRSAALRATDYVMRWQDIETHNLDIRGAIKGSQPVWGSYAPMSFPNWATKFFIDAMLLRQ